MRHDSASVIVARKAASHPRSRIGKSLAAHVLDALCEVALMSLLAVPTEYVFEPVSRTQMKTDMQQKLHDSSYKLVTAQCHTAQGI